jgi:hypothetical protein
MKEYSVHVHVLRVSHACEYMHCRVCTTLGVYVGALLLSYRFSAHMYTCWQAKKWCIPISCNVLQDRCLQFCMHHNITFCKFQSATLSWILDFGRQCIYQRTAVFLLHKSSHSLKFCRCELLGLLLWKLHACQCLTIQTLRITFSRGGICPSSWPANMPCVTPLARWYQISPPTPLEKKMLNTHTVHSIAIKKHTRFQHDMKLIFTVTIATKRCS